MPKNGISQSRMSQSGSQVGRGKEEMYGAIPGRLTDMGFNIRMETKLA